MSSIMSYIAQYGYLAMFGLLALGFMGIPVPDETLVIMFGGLTAEGHFQFGAALAATFLGSMTGMLFSYGLGRGIGKPLLDKYGKWIMITPKRLAATEKWFAKYGSWSVLLGYFVPGLRQVTSYLAGVYRLSLKLYLIYAGVGAAIWCTVFIYIGHTFGKHWRRVAYFVHLHVWRITLAVIVFLVVAWILHMLWKRKNRET
ncbi:DedA family protein [Paenibacillus physcomitrellae]|uniref:Membrane protein YbfM n=1 Tax=Paenibacillus physcomitrellae TaxID=1619311 RepID=A0ABQ1GID0_9BACL|nr:DedA family protein [Paenibacillus physcomitrellae]GGA44411.1 putative membrane protein YbfM [Paenibacillus physcomitrellae]